MGLLYSAHEYVRPSLLDFLFSERPCQRLSFFCMIPRNTELQLLAFSKKRFSLQNDICGHHLGQPNLFPQLKVVGLHDSAREYVRTALLDFLFSEPPPLLAAVLLLFDPSKQVSAVALPRKSPHNAALVYGPTVAARRTGP